MILELKIDSRNDVFSDSPELETSRILHDTADKIVNGRTFGILMDINGNRVGNWYLETDDDD